MKTLVAVILLMAVGAMAQAPAKLADITFTPTDLQLTKLQLAHSRAETAMEKKAAAENSFNAAINNLQGECEKVKTENKWPAETICNMDSVDLGGNDKLPPFQAPPKPPVTDTKPTDKK